MAEARVYFRDSLQLPCLFYGLGRQDWGVQSSEGENVEVSVDLESREYNGRWYTDVKAWKVSKVELMPTNRFYGNHNSNDNKVSEEDDIPF